MSKEGESPIPIQNNLNHPEMDSLQCNSTHCIVHHPNHLQSKDTRTQIGGISPNLRMQCFFPVVRASSKEPTVWARRGEAFQRALRFSLHFRVVLPLPFQRLRDPSRMMKRKMQPRMSAFSNCLSTSQMAISRRV